MRLAASTTLLLTALLAAPGLASAAERSCTCLANGRAYELGERTCLQLPEGPRFALCRMVQNVTSWQIEAEGCTVSGLAGPAWSLAGLDPQPAKNSKNALSVSSGASSGR